MKTEISEKTQEVISRLIEMKEFDGIKFEVTPESEDTWSSDYATFTIDIIDFNLLENPSEETSIEEDEFWCDLEDWIGGFYDDNIEISIDRDNGQVKIYSYKKAHK